MMFHMHGNEIFFKSVAVLISFEWYLCNSHLFIALFGLKTLPAIDSENELWQAVTKKNKTHKDSLSESRRSLFPFTN